MPPLYRLMEVATGKIVLADLVGFEWAQAKVLRSSES